MSWGVLFRIREYLKGSFWFFPLIGAILGPLAVLIVYQADTHVTLPAGWQYPPHGEHAIDRHRRCHGGPVRIRGDRSVLAIQMATGTSRHEHYTRAGGIAAVHPRHANSGS
jgi:hypothetical protein